MPHNSIHNDAKIISFDLNGNQAKRTFILSYITLIIFCGISFSLYTHTSTRRDFINSGIVASSFKDSIRQKTHTHEFPPKEPFKHYGRQNYIQTYTGKTTSADPTCISTQQFSIPTTNPEINFLRSSSTYVMYLKNRGYVVEFVLRRRIQRSILEAHNFS